MIFNFRKRELLIELKEKEIHKAAEDLHKKIERDRKDVQKINAKLANGITLRIAKAAGH